MFWDEKEGGLTPVPQEVAHYAVRSGVHTQAYPTSLTLGSLLAPRDSRPAQDLWLVVHPVPYGFRVILRVTFCFGKRGEDDLLGKRWANRWVQQP